MDNIYLTPERELLREQIARFIAREVEPHALAWEEASATPREVLRKLGDAGLLGLMYSSDYGGSEADALTNLVFAEALSQSTFGGFIITVLVHTDMASPHLHHAGSAEQLARYMPDVIAGRKITAVGITEPGAGSDVAGIRTTAVRHKSSGGDHWVLNGTKMFITNGVHADLYFIAAKTPAGTERIALAAMAVGHCTQALKMTLEFVRQRQAFGAPLFDKQAIRQRLAMLDAKVQAARAFMYQCAWRVTQQHDVVQQVSMLKALTGELVNEVVQTCQQFHGGMGYMRDTAIERLWRDARVLAIGGGATEVMLDEVAKRY